MSLNVRQSLSMTSASRRIITTAARDPSRSTTARLLCNHPLSLPSVTQGFNFNTNTSDIASDQVAAPLPTLLPTQPAQPVSATSHPHIMDIDMPPHDISATLACQRVAADIAKLHVPRPSVQQATRKARTCRRCARPECPGKKSIRECKNPCQDCGKIDQCKGRNPDRLKRPCHTAWVPL